VVTGFVFNTMLVAIAFMLVKGNLTIGVLNLIQVVNSLLFMVLPVATEKWVRSISGVRTLSTSRDHFDVRAVTWRFGERRVAGHDGSIERLAQGYVHGVVRRDVLAQLPRASEEIEMGVTMEIEVGEIRHHVGRSVR
jgi:hypothetical protein